MIPAGCVRSVEVEVFYANKLERWMGDGAWLTVVRAEVGGRAWERPLCPRSLEFAARGLDQRRADIARLRDLIRRALPA